MECKAPCADVICGPHAYCKPDGAEAYCICEEGWTYNPSDIAAGCVDIDECDASVQGSSGRCGQNALCTNTPGGYTCQCPPGFSGNAAVQCIDLDECSKPNRCGAGATCRNVPGSFECSCPDGTVPDPDPSIRCIAIVSCKSDTECPGNAICDERNRCLCPVPNVGNDCRHPCEAVSCGPNANCMIVSQEPKCLCAEGFTGSADQIGGCVDVDECKNSPCPTGSVCMNVPGSYTCQCPGGISGDPYKGGCAKSDIAISCDVNHPCPNDENCITDSLGKDVCICRQGMARDPGTGNCIDINECERQVCGLNAFCKNLPGSYECQCLGGFYGNPYVLCDQCNTNECHCQLGYEYVGGNCILAGCKSSRDCKTGAECVMITGGLSYCACPKGYRTQADGSCVDVDECSEGQHSCGFGAVCINAPGTYKCECPPGYSGDPYHGQCAAPQRRCAADRECGSNEKCVQPGECVCPPPFFLDTLDNNRCKSPCERYPCGINAKCTPSDPPQCMCESGFESKDPVLGCSPQDICLRKYPTIHLSHNVRDYHVWS